MSCRGQAHGRSPVRGGSDDVRRGYPERSEVALKMANQLHGDKQEEELPFVGRKDSGYKIAGSGPGDVNMSLQQLHALSKGIFG